MEGQRFGSLALQHPVLSTCNTCFRF